MVHGDFSEFLVHLDQGDELWVKFRGVVFFIQGWTADIGGAHQHAVMECYDPRETVFHVEKPTMPECAKELLKAPLFDGKPLGEVEQELRWVDDETGIEPGESP